MTQAEFHLQTAKKWVQGMNQHDEEALGALCTDDVEAVETAWPDEVCRGRAAVVGAYRELFESFPDCRTEITSTVADANGVLLEVVWSGTNTRPFRGTPASRKKSKLLIAYVFYFKGGKIHRIREYYDELTYEVDMGQRTR